MALTKLDPSAALIVVDLQRGMTALSMATPLAEVAARASTLTAAFRRRGLSVVLVTNDGAAPGRREQNAMRAAPPGTTELLPELGARPGDHRVTKRSPGAFTATGLDAWLKSRSVTQVVIAGVATGTGVETTARQAYELGFNVTCAIDAMTDMDSDVHANSVTRIFPRIGETGTTDEIIELLAGS